MTAPDLRATLDAHHWLLTPVARVLSVSVSSMYDVLRRAGLLEEYYARRATRPKCSACGLCRATVGRGDGLCGDCRGEAKRVTWVPPADRARPRCTGCGERPATRGRDDGLCGYCRHAVVTPCGYCCAPTSYRTPEGYVCRPGTGCAVVRVRRTA